jgi:tetratricopeptide (TPR) repeat protein
MLSNECKVAIEKWIDGNASDEDHAILQQSSQDATFNQHVELQKAVGIAIDKVHREQLRAELKVLIKRNDNVRSIFFERKLWYAAAAVVVILISALLFLSKKNTPSAETLYYSYYKPYHATSLTRGEENSQAGTALQLYDERKYELAVATLEKTNIQKATVEGTYILLILGNCYLNLNEAERASECFLMASRSSDNVIAAHANWYHALTLLKENKISDAINAFEDIADSNSFYSSRAKEIVTVLRNIR